MKNKATKYCARCGETQPIAEFRLIRKTPGGPRLPRCMCRTCENLAQNERNARKAAGMTQTEIEVDEFKQLQPWPWPPGVKVFEDMNVRRAA
jgi:hypothetical protein